MSQSEALTPVIFRQTLSPNTEYGFTLPKGTKHFEVEVIGTGSARMAFDMGNVADGTGVFHTIRQDQPYRSPEKVGWSGDQTGVGDEAVTPSHTGGAAQTTTVFSWEMNETGTQQADWNTYRAGLATGDEGRPVGANATKHTTANSHKMFAGQNMEVATMEVTGELRFARTVPVQNIRTLMAVQPASSDNWTDWYMHPEVERTLEFRAGLIDDTVSLATYKDNSQTPWILIAEMWTDMNGPSWGGGGEVPVQIIIDNPGGSGDNQFLARVRGSSETVPTDYEVETEVAIAPLDTSMHDFRIEWRHSINKDNAYFRLYFDGVLKVNIQAGSQPIGINDPVNGINNGAAPYFGLYSSGAPTGSEIQYENISIRE